jgi:hypothetical protein
MGETNSISKLFSFGGSTLDTESKTASRGAVDLQIVGAGMGEQFFNGRLELAI